ncbi:uncharacterized protein LOC34623245 [Cyclospora cayetanensis]|uniref:Uncharacterized protein LOC34623245 n=1 Tax=Cyclospora cayetanensis TaxID=88456 RepID=A0A6P6S3I2_9EIME|nr:uncharacterized protein LOC34623245 [Cyclospora cayetanensis]
MGALSPQPPNLALLFRDDPGSLRSTCNACSNRTRRSWGYLMRLSGLVRPWHAQHKLGVLGALSCEGKTPTNSKDPESSSNRLSVLLHPHSAVERFSKWEGEKALLSSHLSGQSCGSAELFASFQQHDSSEPAGEADGSHFWGTHYLPAAATAAAVGPPRVSSGAGDVSQGEESKCKACRVAASWLKPPAPSRQQLLLACPSLSQGFIPDSVLLQHRLVQGLLLAVQEETRFVKLVQFDRQYWVTSVDGDVVLLHYYRHRTDPKACSTSWGSADPAAAAEAVGCTDSRFPHGKPHGTCGCRGILFIVGGIGAKAYDLQVQHVVLLAAAKGFCVFFLSCLRGIEAPIASLPTDLTTSADVQAALAFILYIHVNGFEKILHQERHQDLQSERKEGIDKDERNDNSRCSRSQIEEQEKREQKFSQWDSRLTMNEVDVGFRKMIMEAAEDGFLKSIPSGFIPPVFLLGYSMGSCAVMRLLGSLGLQQAIQRLQQMQQQQRQTEDTKEYQQAAAGTPCTSTSDSSNCSNKSEPDLSPFCRDLAAAVASEYLPSLEWLRFLKGAVTISNAMCLDSCIGSLDRASGITGRLCKNTMLKMYKSKQWLEPSISYMNKGLDPGLVALSQMTSTLREIDMLTHLSICLTPASPLACSRVYYALTTCLPHMLLAPLPLLCLHALDDPIVEPLGVCRAAATVPKYNSNCTYAVVGKGGHNLFQESFWPLVVSALWRWLRSWLRSGVQTHRVSVHPEHLYIDESYQARVALEFITGVWRRCS